MKVYVLQHVHCLRRGVEDIKLVGIYSSEANAISARERLSVKPGFSDTPDGFYIDEYQLDKDHWVDGFGDAFEGEDLDAGVE